MPAPPVSVLTMATMPCLRTAHTLPRTQPVARDRFVRVGWTVEAVSSSVPQRSVRSALDAILYSREEDVNKQRQAPGCGCGGPQVTCLHPRWVNGKVVGARAAHGPRHQLCNFERGGGQPVTRPLDPWAVVVLLGAWLSSASAPAAAFVRSSLRACLFLLVPPGGPRQRSPVCRPSGLTSGLMPVLVALWAMKADVVSSGVPLEPLRLHPARGAALPAAQNSPVAYGCWTADGHWTGRVVREHPRRQASTPSRQAVRWAACMPLPTRCGLGGRRPRCCHATVMVMAESRVWTAGKQGHWL